MGFLQRLKMKLQLFMAGRYGADQLSRFISVAAIALIVVQFVMNLLGWTVVSTVIWAIVWLLLIWNLFRTFSRQTAKRYAENQKYIIYKNKLKAFVKLQKDRLRDRKTHIYRHCPQCHCVLRLPKKKGKHTVKCPKCGRTFTVKSFF